MRILLVAALAVGLTALPAYAEVTASSPSAFEIHGEANVAASPAQAWRALTRVEGWWNSEHTYSRDARNLSLEPRAGGCWCERWSGNSVQHMRVLMAMQAGSVRTLRLSGGLGPLQQMGVTGIMTFVITPQPSGAKIEMTYRVTGDPGLALDRIAPGVDGVLMEQFGRLVRYTEGGGSHQSPYSCTAHPGGANFRSGTNRPKRRSSVWRALYDPKTSDRLDGRHLHGGLHHRGPCHQ